MKKSILLSSIMAIVLVLALSTATFAWYGSSTTATAEMATLTASSGDGNLQIKGTGDDTYGSRVDITQTGVYVPASIKANTADTITAWDTATNWVVGHENADGTNNLKAVTDETNYVMKYTVTIKNAGADTIDVNLAQPAFASAAINSDSNAVKSASTQLVTDCTWMIFMTRKMTDGSPALNGTDTTTVFNNEAYSETTLSGTAINNQTLGDGADVKGTVTAVNTLKIEGMLAGEEITFTVYNWIDGWEASSEAATNSQQGKVKFTLNFSIDTSAQG